MIKSFLFLCLSFVIFNACDAQQFFKPLPRPGIVTGKFAPKATTTTVPSTMNVFRPVASVTASIDGGAQLAGGAGISFQHNTYDNPSNSWVTQYSVSALAFIDTKASIVGGLAFGFLNFISIGPGYSFTDKKFVLLTGVQIKFN